MEIAMACTTSMGGTQALASKQSRCQSVHLKHAGALPNAGPLPIRFAYIHRGVRCYLSESQPSDTREVKGVAKAEARDDDGNEKKMKKLLSQLSWEGKYVLENDYLYRLGNEADNMNIMVGAKSGMVDSLFANKNVS